MSTAVWTYKAVDGAGVPSKGQVSGATKDAVTLWQHAHLPGTTLFGEVWPDDWRKLFTF